jgi:RNA polymerase sigma-70 factor, ECF subfamily
LAADAKNADYHWWDRVRSQWCRVAEGNSRPTCTQEYSGFGHGREVKPPAAKKRSVGGPNALDHVARFSPSEAASVPMPSTHASLLCEIRGGDRRDEIWAAFSSRYRDVIMTWCARRGLAADDAEDLTQDVLLKLFQHLPEHTHDPLRGSFRGWLKAVVNNALADYWRRRPTCGAVGGTTFMTRAAGVPSPETEELSTAIEGRARGTAEEVVGRVRAKLKETTWQAFYLSMIERRPAAEVAAGLSLSVASVYKATYRVKQMLQEEFGHVHLSDAASLVPEPGGAKAVPE